MALAAPLSSHRILEASHSMLPESAAAPAARAGIRQRSRRRRRMQASGTLSRLRHDADAPRFLRRDIHSVKETVTQAAAAGRRGLRRQAAGAGSPSAGCLAPRSGRRESAADGHAACRHAGAQRRSSPCRCAALRYRHVHAMCRTARGDCGRDGASHGGNTLQGLRLPRGGRLRQAERGEGGGLGLGGDGVEISRGGASAHARRAAA